METSLSQSLGAPADGRARAIVLVEGHSDRLALEILARRRGRDLEREGIRVVAMGGATNVGRYLDRYGPRGLDVKVAGLYDSAEERFFVQGLARAGLGLGAQLSTIDLQERGFFRCTQDLEDELIRALGAEQVEQLVAAHGELASFRRLQRQPAQRERSLHDQLRRLMGGRSGGKLRYAGIMAEAVDLDRVPRPLSALLDHV